MKMNKHAFCCNSLNNFSQSSPFLQIISSSVDVKDITRVPLVLLQLFSAEADDSKMDAALIRLGNLNTERRVLAQIKTLAVRAFQNVLQNASSNFDGALKFLLRGCGVPLGTFLGHLKSSPCWGRKEGECGWLQYRDREVNSRKFQIIFVISPVFWGSLQKQYHRVQDTIRGYHLPKKVM